MSDTSRIDIVTVELARPLLREYYDTLLATGDEYANRFGAKIVRNGNAVDLAGYTVSGSFVRPDGATVALDGVKDGNTVFVDLTAPCYKENGKFTLFIKIVNADEAITVRMVDGYIRQTDTGSYVATDETLITLDQMKGLANELSETNKKAKAVMADLEGVSDEVEQAIEDANHVADKLPYIGDNGNWYRWDDEAGEFVDSGSPSCGERGEPGESVSGVDEYAREQLATLNEEIVVRGVTPQMYGAVGDGEADDTDAVQSALNAGGVIYFPAGRYKVTRQLTVTKSCVIRMFKPYPCTYQGDYPLTADDNWMGARIETYATEGCGLLIGDGVQIDGLYIRAMAGFTGILFKFDGTLGCRTYPSQVKLSHIRIDNASHTIMPEAMFDFNPKTGYHYILDDITIGSLRGRQFCIHGFRSVMTNNADNWANSVIIRNMCIDILADYPLYIEGSHAAGQWTFDNLTIQSCTYKGGSEYHDRTGHIAIVTLKNMFGACFFGGHIYDLDASNYTAVFDVTNCIDIASYGNGSFDEIDTVLSGKFQTLRDDFSEHLNIRKLTMNVEAVAETGANRLTLSDGEHQKQIDIPAAMLSDEQIGKGIEQWFEENAEPKVMPGKNKFNPDDANTIPYVLQTNGSPSSQGDATTTNFIEAAYDDDVRLGLNGMMRNPYVVYFYDESKSVIERRIISSESPDKIRVNVEGTAYIRMTWFDGFVTYEDRHTAQLCITVNEPNLDYEPYGEKLTGGITSYLLLESPNGTKYTLSVDDNGVLTAKIVD